MRIIKSKRQSLFDFLTEILSAILSTLLLDAFYIEADPCKRIADLDCRRERSAARNNKNLIHQSTQLRSIHVLRRKTTIEIYFLSFWAISSVTRCSNKKYPKSAKQWPKRSHSSFYFKSSAFHSCLKISIYLGYFCK